MKYVSRVLPLRTAQPGQKASSQKTHFSRRDEKKRERNALGKISAKPRFHYADGFLAVVCYRGVSVQHPGQSM